MSNKKHPPPLRCRIRKALGAVHPSGFACCYLGVYRTKKCRGCTENVGERIQEGFEEGLRKGAEVPSIQEQLQAHAVEMLKEMQQPERTYVVKSEDLLALDTSNYKDFTEMRKVKIDEQGNLFLLPKE